MEASAPRWVEFACPDCDWLQVAGRDEMHRALVQAKLAKPGYIPDPELLTELLATAAPRLPCGGCGRPGIIIRPCAEDDEAQWEWAPVCELCKKPIPPERLEAIPDARTCVACQQKDERGEAAEVEYCPSCGSLMAYRTSRERGVTRYVLVCTAYPKCRGSRGGFAFRDW